VNALPFAQANKTEYSVFGSWGLLVVNCSAFSTVNTTLPTPLDVCLVRNAKGACHMQTKRLSKLATILIFLAAIAALFLIGKYLLQSSKPTPVNCPSEALGVTLQASSTSPKVGDTLTITTFANRYIGRPVYFLNIIDVEPVQGSAKEYFLPQGLNIRLNSQIVNQEIEVLDLEALDLVKGIGFVMRVEQAGSFTVTFSIDGETGNDCAGYQIWNNVRVHSDPLTINVSRP
jgi:hypothetical protein